MRYQKYNYLTKNFQLSKSKVFKMTNLISIKNLDILAGHFKPTGTFVEHGLLITNICGQIPYTELFKHGKRLKNTVTVQTSVSSKWKWAVLDKFLTSFLPSISDLRGYTSKKHKSSLYSWRIRSFFEWADADVLLSDRITKKDAFLPLFVNITLNSKYSQKFNEDYLRMLRIPARLSRSLN
jgi:hypothetical protein